MPRQSIQNDGTICYRTKLMEEVNAESFRACLAANASFFNVHAAESDQAKADSDRRWFVTFQPANSLRFWEMVNREQDKRTAKAETEGAGYLFWLDAEGGRCWYWVFNPVSGEIYEVTNQSCTCPDWMFRCSRNADAGIRCKHQIALDSRVKSGQIEDLREARTRLIAEQFSRKDAPKTERIPVTA